MKSTLYSRNRKLYGAHKSEVAGTSLFTDA